MNLAKKLSLLLSLAAAMTLSAHAQDAKAKFTLAHNAHVGTAMLPAGQYTMTLSFDGFTKAIIAPVDRKGTGMIVLPVSTDSYAACSATTVSMQRDGATWNLRSVCFADQQLALYFAAPAEKTALASATPTPETIAGSR